MIGKFVIPAEAGIAGNKGACSSRTAPASAGATAKEDRA
jgi:hypothetical protein